MVYQVAALYIDATGPYPDLAADCWDIDRDASRYAGHRSVVAHPPCRSWSRLRTFAKPAPGEQELGLLAVEQVRQWGGVLEHPAGSALWPAAGLPAPGCSDEFGFSTAVDQRWFGHRARKRTLLYIVGIRPQDLPAFPLDLRPATHTVGLWSGRDRSRALPELPKREFHLSPIGFAHWLCQVAERCQIQARIQ